MAEKGVEPPWAWWLEFDGWGLVVEVVFLLGLVYWYL